ncbi:MAG: hypothetical protein HW416_484 [Chloroflexi bacterium]|nr:hypothetical protein [Chloroflexota bacterium]
MVGKRNLNVPDLLDTVGNGQLTQVKPVRNEEYRLGIAVLVVVGQVLQEGQRVNIGHGPAVGAPCHSVVRLEALNESALRWIELISGAPRLDPFLVTCSDRELDARHVSWGAIGEPTGALPSELVESGSEGVCNVGDRVSEPKGEFAHIGHLRNAEDVVAGLRIELGAQYCEARWVS